MLRGLQTDLFFCPLSAHHPAGDLLPAVLHTSHHSLCWCVCLTPHPHRCLCIRFHASLCQLSSELCATVPAETQNRIQASLAAHKIQLMQTEEKADPWNYKITTLLLSFSVCHSLLSNAPHSLRAVILRCTDADQMEDWKMKGVTDEKEGRRKKMERESQ